MTYVNISIYTAPGANIENNRIKRDLLLAQEIWRPIFFRVDTIIQLGSSYKFYNREISYLTPFKNQPKVRRLLEQSIALSPASHIYICYVGGDYFQEPHVIGCACSQRMHNVWKGFILLTNMAAPRSNMYTLAHEIGHILFTRRQNGLLTNADPHCPYGSAHHPSPSNLMHSVVPTPKQVRQLDHLLTDVQRETALKNSLIYKNGNL